MIKEIEKIHLKKIDYVHRDDSHKHETIDIFRVLGFPSDKLNTISDSRVAILN